MRTRATSMILDSDVIFNREGPIMIYFMTQLDETGRGTVPYDGVVWTDSGSLILDGSQLDNPTDPTL